MPGKSIGRTSAWWLTEGRSSDPDAIPHGALPRRWLDPLIATDIDGEIIKLRDLEHVTSLLVTHQIRDAFYIATHQAVRHDGRVLIAAAVPGPPLADFMLLRDGRIQFTGTAEELLASTDPYVKEYLTNTLPPW